VQAAYTENHVTGPEMYQQVRAALHELGQFEDIIQDGHVRGATAALWFSETGDIWDDNRAPFDAAKRTLYLAIRHQQIPLDVVVEADALSGELKGYRLLYLTDQHVSRAASKAIADWVAAGGRLLATAGAGMSDELDRPNAVLRELLGVDQKSLNEPADPLRWEKADLPFAPVVDTVISKQRPPIPVIGVRSRLAPAAGTRTQATFADASPAIVTRSVGKGEATCCAFLPGLSYFKPAIPLRPADRGTTDDAMAHFIPTAFDRGAGALVAAAADGIERPVACSEPLVESTIIDSPHGMLVPLVNWSGHAVKQLTVKFPDGAHSKSATLATGVTVRREGDSSFILDLDVADALILR
jgi:hypothetical protein